MRPTRAPSRIDGGSQQHMPCVRHLHSHTRLFGMVSMCGVIVLVWQAIVRACCELLVCGLLTTRSVKIVIFPARSTSTTSLDENHTVLYGEESGRHEQHTQRSGEAGVCMG